MTYAAAAPALIASRDEGGGSHNELDDGRHDDDEVEDVEVVAEVQLRSQTGNLEHHLDDEDDREDEVQDFQVLLEARFHRMVIARESHRLFVLIVWFIVSEID